MSAKTVTVTCVSIATGGASVPLSITYATSGTDGKGYCYMFVM
jgi:hypothetical protein